MRRYYDEGSHPQPAFGDSRRTLPKIVRRGSCLKSVASRKTGTTADPGRSSPSTSPRCLETQKKIKKATFKGAEDLHGARDLFSNCENFLEDLYEDSSMPLSSLIGAKSAEIEVPSREALKPASLKEYHDSQVSIDDFGAATKRKEFCAPGNAYLSGKLPVLSFASEDQHEETRALWIKHTTDMDRYVAIYAALNAHFEQRIGVWLTVQQMEKVLAPSLLPLATDDVRTLLHYARSSFDARWGYNKKFYVYDRLEVRKTRADCASPALAHISKVDHFRQLMTQDLQRYLLTWKKTPITMSQPAPKRGSSDQVLRRMFAERSRCFDSVVPEQQESISPPESFSFCKIKLEPPVVNSQVV